MPSRICRRDILFSHFPLTASMPSCRKVCRGHLPGLKATVSRCRSVRRPFARATRTKPRTSSNVWSTKLSWRPWSISPRFVQTHPFGFTTLALHCSDHHAGGGLQPFQEAGKGNLVRSRGIVLGFCSNCICCILFSDTHHAGVPRLSEGSLRIDSHGRETVGGKTSKI